jgi:hypothetical protein
MRMLKDGSLTYDASSGTLLGLMPRPGVASIFGELTIGGTVARSVECDGPAICSAPFGTSFQLSRTIQIHE